MGSYNELDTIIADYVGFNEEDDMDNGMMLSCADPVLYDSITEELTRYMNKSNHMPFEYLSDDAKICFREWEDLMRDVPTVNMEEISELF